jgi:enamine deaminase RidA (YjgF/YER057c/UK114 family)
MSPPTWIQDVLDKAGDCGRLMLTSRIVRDAEHLSDDALREQTRDAYEAILDDVRARRQYPVRFWNHVPNLNAAASLRRDRYMVFNAGRYEAMVNFYGCPARFDAQLATASAVGSMDGDLLIHCLSAGAAATPLNNPRQVAPYHYSRRFGPLPPCFARAVRLAWPARWLLAGGTAAIRGEDSVYREDPNRQINETLTNLAALVCAALGRVDLGDTERLLSLRHYRHLRVYFPNREHEKTILAHLHAVFPNVQPIERVVVNLCRPELLVEIEGVAELPA